MNITVSNFGKFKLLKQIARGGMAEIFLGCSGNIESAYKFVVIKRILAVHSHNKEFNKMFQSEGKIAVNLNHSNIGSIHEFGVEKNQYFICMEYISGRNIRQLLKKMKSQKKSLEPALCAHIIRNVCNGLDYAHNCTDSITGQPLNIIHRDISPQNIMISFNGDVKVIDFGIAKIDNSESTKVGVLKGKFEYMSPEQVRGKELDRQTDIFSLGNVFWEILAGKKLFTGNNEIKLLKKIRDCQIPDLKKINPKVPPRLVEIINKSLNPNKNLRYKTMGEMGNDISLFMNKFYPNFTHTNFSAFIKELYVEEILEERQNLKRYSQVLASKKKKISSLPRNKESLSTSTFIGYTKKAELPQQEEPSQEEDINSQYTETNPPITKATQEKSSSLHSQYTITQTQQTDSKFSSQNNKQEMTSTEFDDRLEHGTVYTNIPNQNTQDSEESYQIKSDGFRNSITLGTAVELSNKQTTHTNTEVPKEGINPDADDPIGDYQPWKTNVKSINRKALLRRKKRNSIFRKTILVLFILGMIGGGYIFQSDQKTNTSPASELNQSKSPNDNVLKHSSREPTTVKPAQPKQPILTRARVDTQRLAIPRKSIFITTKPSGAQLYINGKKIEYLTPTSIMVPSDTFQLMIKKQDYHDQKVVLSTDSIENTINFVLKKSQRRKKKRRTLIIKQ